MLVATLRPRTRSRASTQDAGLRRARSCYDHLAGRLAVALAEGLVRRGLLRRTADAFSVTAEGEHWFAELGIDVAALQRSQRPLARCCLDWSERRDHIAGGLGAALLQCLLAKGHVARQRDGRALTVTPAGERFFAIACGDDLPAVA
jgi:hypothetical protein